MSAPSDSRRIVVGVDGSPSSIEALRWARRIGTALAVPIHAVIAWEYPASYGLGAAPTDWQPDVDAGRQLTDALTTAFGENEAKAVSAQVSEGHAAQILVEASAGAEMLVVGSRGHGGFVGLLLGSVSAYCAEHAACPVVVLHDNPDNADNPGKH
jgi:nucleotide-binding universal stress UspA family protein